MNLKKIHKLYIMGPPGSGKSTFASRISEITKIPNFDLDDVSYRKNEYRKLSAKERNDKLNEILKNHKSWVIEGSYASPWILPALKKADFLVILNKSSWLIKQRLVLRYIKRFFGFDKTEKGAGTLCDLKRLLNYASTYKKDYYLKHLALAHKLNKKLTIIKTKNEFNKFLRELK